VPSVLFSCAGWEKAGGKVARQQLKIDGGKPAPHEPTSQYQHNRTGEDNADAHLKRQVIGREVVVAITKGKLDLGPWEQIFYGEFDGRRCKRVLVKIIGE
jgi:secondary thiamine-phosphate synthase enzyme